MLRIGNNIFFILIFLNLLILNLWVLGYVKPILKAAMITKVQERTDVSSSSACDQQCIDKLYYAIYTATTSAQPIPIVTKSSSVSNQNVGGLQEYYVSLGSGTNTTATWTNVPGVQGYIDTTKYGSIQTVTFEASLFVPTGNQIAYVQLYDATNKHPVWFSTMSMSGGDPQLLISNPITLSSGNNLYQVQMMSQLGFLTNLVSARVHIVAY